MPMQDFGFTTPPEKDHSADALRVRDGLILLDVPNEPSRRFALQFGEVKAEYDAVGGQNISAKRGWSVSVSGHYECEFDSWSSMIAVLCGLARNGSPPTRPSQAPPVPMFLTCPACGARHIDEGEFRDKPHHTHACQSCGLTWRPAIVPTVGVKFLPGFRNVEHDEGFVDAPKGVSR